MRRKVILFILLIVLILASISASAQDQNAEMTLSQRFSMLKFKDQFIQPAAAKYYRFPIDTDFFDPLDLSFFPHEKWDKENWALLGRWKNGKTYDQMIFSDKPAKYTLIHGTEVGSTGGYWKNFYLYTDLFVVDNYPKKSGSCYVYYSNSIMTGLNESIGIMIDPESGIYSITNNYGGERFKTYSQYSIDHDFSLIKRLDPEKDGFSFSLDNLEKTSIGSVEFPQLKLDEQFAGDLEYLTNAYRMPNASPVKAYRIEIVRLDGISEIYINGKLVASFSDKIYDSFRDPDKVSWSYGPMLYEDGLTVTCSAGEIYIYGTGAKE